MESEIYPMFAQSNEPSSPPSVPENEPGEASSGEIEGVPAEALPGEDEAALNELQSDPIMSVISFLVGLYFFKLWWEDTVNAERGNPHPKAFPGTYRAPMPIIGLAIAGSIGLVLFSTVGELAFGFSDEQSDTIWVALLGWIGAAFLEELIVRGYGGSMIERGWFQFILGPLGFKKPTPPAEPETVPVTAVEDDSSAASEHDSAAAKTATENQTSASSAETEATAPGGETTAAADEPVAKVPVKPRPPSPASLRELLPGMVLISILFAVAHPFLWSVDFPEPDPTGQGPGGVTRYLHGEYSLRLDEGYQWWVTLMVGINSLFWFYVRYSSKNPKRSLLPCYAGHVAANITVFVVKLMQGHVVGVWGVGG
ncbi:MAG: hypothetical protein ACFB21_07715 [Opitutales bacterium]